MASITRHASAEWHGSGKDGTGSLTPRGTLKDTPYGFNTRFGDAKGTNTEELIAGRMRAASAWQPPFSSAAPECTGKPAH